MTTVQFPRLARDETAAQNSVKIFPSVSPEPRSTVLAHLRGFDAGFENFCASSV